MSTYADAGRCIHTMLHPVPNEPWLPYATKGLAHQFLQYRAVPKTGPVARNSLKFLNFANL